MKMLLMMTVLIFMAVDVAADPNNETLTRAYLEQIARNRMATMERLQAAIEQRQQKVVAELLLATQAKPLPALATMDEPVVLPRDCANVITTCELPLPCLAKGEGIHFATLGID